MALRQKTPDWMRVLPLIFRNTNTHWENVLFVCACVECLHEGGVGVGSSRGGICRARIAQLQRQSIAKFLWLTGSPRVGVWKHCIPPPSVLFGARVCVPGAHRSSKACRGSLESTLYNSFKVIYHGRQGNLNITGGWSRDSNNVSTSKNPKVPFLNICVAC